MSRSGTNSSLGSSADCQGIVTFRQKSAGGSSDRDQQPLEFLVVNCTFPEVHEFAYDAGGLDGDDDCGQMSAWLLFTAMGFYPVNPASGEYMIGSPLYRTISLRLGNGKIFRVEAENNSTTNVYIQSATIDNKPLNIPVITWEQIQSGALLRFVMGRESSTA